MRQRTTRGDLRLTEQGLGTAQLGNLFGAISDEQSHAVVAAAWNAGIRYFDSAPHYGLGLSERRLGEALASFPRDEYVVSTKVGRLLVPSRDDGRRTDDEGFDVAATMVREWDFSRDGVLRSIEQSLSRLGLDRIDIAYLHDPDDHWPEASTTGVGALLELRDQGVVRAIGVGMNQSAMPAEFIRQSDIDLVMVAGCNTLLNQSAWFDLFPVAESRGVGIVSAGVYNSGILARSHAEPGDHFNYAPAPAEITQRANTIAAVCAEFDLSLAEAAVAFARLHPVVVSTVLGARSAEQVRENAARGSVTAPQELWDALAERDLISLPLSTSGAA
ncbi:aldo/keto reductase [Subtercola endophyticus]|uniref:aldo/keto reductase n=1 Tax=Subtercola endophyticus TaxID=2895559 RepID=UPI001E44D005|nr:aldo/keto reductase [Subtercola endophyticus]UFS58727.1 aldo/keto reductase [Subtercola endophyticus]